jgi:hypothetical protein
MLTRKVLIQLELERQDLALLQADYLALLFASTSILEIWIQLLRQEYRCWFHRFRLFGA